MFASPFVIRFALPLVLSFFLIGLANTTRSAEHLAPSEISGITDHHSLKLAARPIAEDPDATIPLPTERSTSFT